MRSRGWGPHKGIMCAIIYIYGIYIICHYIICHIILYVMAYILYAIIRNDIRELDFSMCQVRRQQMAICQSKRELSPGAGPLVLNLLASFRSARK